MFRLIAIETQEPDEELRSLLQQNNAPNAKTWAGRAAMYRFVMRIIKPGQVFYFSNDYKITKSKHIVRKSNNSQSQSYIYSIGDSDKYPSLTISAIVGENGQGKSTLLELLYRLINNVAFACNIALQNEIRDRLRFTEELFLALYFEDEHGDVYRLEEKNYEMSLFKNNGSNAIWQTTISPLDIGQDKKRSSNTHLCEARSVLEGLFYTISISFSSYAFNPWDYLLESEMSRDEDGTEKPVCWFDELFHKNDAYQTPIVLNPYRVQGQIDFNNERDLLMERLYEMILDEGAMVRDILNGKQIVRFKFDISNSGMSYLQPDVSHLYKSNAVVGILKSYGWIDGDSGNNFDEAENYGNAIVEAWCRVVGFDLRCGCTNHSDMDALRTLNYVVYKTIKIVKWYVGFRQFEDAFFPSIRKERLLQYIQALYLDGTHVTLKLRRCIAYLIFRFYGTGPIKNLYKKNQIISVQDYRNLIANYIADQSRIIQERCQSYPISNAQCAPKQWHREELWPAPSFEVDFYLRDNGHLNSSDPKYDIEYSSLSSGEKQMIATLSSMIYHLRNLSSRWLSKNDSLRYKNVCVIMDEAELYSHPNMQMQFVKNIIRSIHGLDFRLSDGKKSIQGIHVIVATHSPFILSDIVKENVLCIKDGKPAPNQLDNPFAANVYDILSSGFFMDDTIGCLAKDKIGEIVEIYHKKLKTKKKIFQRNKNNWYELAHRVGDRYLSNTLIGMLDELSDFYS